MKLSQLTKILSYIPNACFFLQKNNLNIWSRDDTVIWLLARFELKYCKFCLYVLNCLKCFQISILLQMSQKLDRKKFELYQNDYILIKVFELHKVFVC